MKHYEIGKIFLVETVLPKTIHGEYDLEITKRKGLNVFRVSQCNMCGYAIIGEERPDFNCNKYLTLHPRN